METRTAPEAEDPEPISGAGRAKGHAGPSFMRLPARRGTPWVRQKHVLHNAEVHAYRMTLPWAAPTASNWPCENALKPAPKGVVSGRVLGRYLGQGPTRIRRPVLPRMGGIANCLRSAAQPAARWSPRRTPRFSFVPQRSGRVVYIQVRTSLAVATKVFSVCNSSAPSWLGAKSCHNAATSSLQKIL